VSGERLSLDDRMRDLLEDPEFREDVAERAYMRERAEEAAADREHDLDQRTTYFAVAWESVSDASKKPYRTAVHEALDTVLALDAA